MGATAMSGDDGESLLQGDQLDRKEYFSSPHLARSLKIGAFLFSPLQRLVSETILSLQYIYRNMYANRRAFFIAVVTVFAAVVFVTLLQALVMKVPVVFVKLGENSVGENDIVLTAGITSVHSSDAHPNKKYMESYGKLRTASGALLNTTLIEAQMKANGHVMDYFKGISPRWILLAQVGNILSPEYSSTAVVLIVDNEKEKEIGLGRSYGDHPLGPFQATLTGSTARGAKVAEGDVVNLYLDLQVLADTLGFALGDVRGPMEDAFKLAVHSALEGRTVNLSNLNRTLLIEEVERALNTTLSPEVKLLIERIPIGENGTVPLNSIFTDSVLEMMFEAIYRNSDGKNVRIDTDITVKSVVEDPGGKWPVALGNVVVLESKYTPLLLQRLLPSYMLSPRVLKNILSRIPGYILPPEDKQEDITQLLMGFPMEQYALQVTGQFTDRMEAYTLSGYARSSLITKWTDALFTSIGWDAPVVITAPLDKTLKLLDIPRSFMMQILFTAVIVMVCLCVMVIYSLLLANVEEKTYEFGMIRALGMRNRSMIILLSIQAITYAIPGIILGISFAVLLNIPISILIAYYATLPVDLSIHWSAFALGTALGIFMPIVANIIPIRKALGRTLRDALDLYHSDANDTIVKVQTLEDMGLSLVQSVIAAIVVIVGFGVFYLIPLAFLFQYWGLFFLMVNLTVLGMVLGLSMIAANFQVFQEKLFLHLFMHFKWRRFKKLVRMQLKGHAGRNRKTAMMFTITLAFIIFTAAIFNLQIDSVSDNVRVVAGSDIVFWSRRAENPLPRDEMDAFLRLYKEGKDGREKLVKDYTFMSYRMDELVDMNYAYLSNPSWYPSGRARIQAVEENFLQTAYDQYLVLGDVGDTDYTRKTPTGKPDVVYALYEQESGDAIDGGLPDISVPPYLLNGVAEDVVSPLYMGEDNNFTTWTQSLYQHPIRSVTSTSEEGLVVKADATAIVQQGAKVNDRVHSTLLYFTRPTALISKMPGIPGFNWLRSFAQLVKAPVVTTMATFTEIHNDAVKKRMQLYEGGYVNSLDDMVKYNSTAYPPISKVLIRMVDPNDDSASEFITNGLRSLVDKNQVIISNVAGILHTLSYMVNLLMTFFYVVVAIAMALCFFVLLVSFTSNVSENSWEFGVLRSIGLSQAEVTACYVWEAAAVVIVSVVNSIFIGSVVALTLSLQSTLFNNMPMIFYFPIPLFSFTVLVSIIVTFLGSILPARSIGKRAIALVLKGL